MKSSLTSARFVLIILIVISHTQTALPLELHDSLGEMSVAAFFVLSGFVLSLGKGQRVETGGLTWRCFMAGRIVKIYPLYMAMLIIALIVDACAGNHHSLPVVASTALLLQSWVPRYAMLVNGPAWFLSDLMAGYALFFPLYRFATNASRRRLATAVMLGCGLCIVVALTAKGDCSASYVYTFPLLRLADFSLGIVAFRIYSSMKSGKSRLSKPACHALDTAVVMMMAGACVAAPGINPNLRCATYYWLPAVAMIVYLALRDDGNGWLIALLHNRRIMWLGSISFDIYLTHMPVMKAAELVAERLQMGDATTEPWFAAVQIALVMGVACGVAHGRRKGEKWLATKIK